jgi:hypothetical protein
VKGLIVVTALCAAPLCSAASSTTNSAALKWQSRDVGVVGIKGDGRAHGSDVVVAGSGPTSANAFHYVFVPIVGDGDLVARLEAVTSRENHRAGLMLRSSEVVDAAQASVLVTGDGEDIIEVRPKAGAPVRTIDSAESKNLSGRGHRPWMRITREGAHVSLFSSADGHTWNELWAADLSLGETALFGFAVATSGSQSLATADFREVALRAPFSGRPASIPGVIEAEDFDFGTEGLTYEVAKPDGSPMSPALTARGRYRDALLDVEPTFDGRGFYLGHARPGSWAEYSVSVSKDDTYRIEVRTASVGCGGAFHVEVDGVDRTGPLGIPNTDNPDARWATVAKDGVRLTRGPHRMRLVMDAHDGRGDASFESIRVLPLPDGLATSRTSVRTEEASAQAGHVHPRLLVTPERLESLRQSIRARGYLQDTFQALKARVDAREHSALVKTPAKLRMNGTVLAREAAFLYLLTNDLHYAAVAFSIVESAYNEAVSETSDIRTALDAAFAYDWCHGAWSPAQRDTVRRRIVAALDTCPCVTRENLMAPYRRAAVARVRGSELLLMLAIDEEVQRPERYAALQEILKEHLENGFGSTGFSPLGFWNADYSGISLAPAAYATHQAGAVSRTTALGNREWWRLLMFTQPVDSRVGGPRTGRDPEEMLPRNGWLSLLLPTVPSSDLSSYLWLYERLVGPRSASGQTAEGSLPFDSNEGGAIWTLLYYPETSSATSPNERLPRMLADQQEGAVFFRSRWKDGNDVLVSALASSQPILRSSEGIIPETFDLNIIARGHRFAESREDIEAPAHEISTLLVDGQAYKNVTDRGSLTLADARARGGYAIFDGQSKYGSLGLTTAHRHLAVDFDRDGSGGVLVALDHLEAPNSHIYTWQLHYGSDRRSEGLHAAEGVEDGVPTFVIRAADGAFLKGWVLTPGATVVPDEPLQVSIEAARTDLWIPIVIGDGEPPRAKVKGAGLKATLEVNGRVVRFDAKANRIVLSSSL